FTHVALCLYYFPLPSLSIYPATPAIYPLSLHDALPILDVAGEHVTMKDADDPRLARVAGIARLPDGLVLLQDPGDAREARVVRRSEEHTSELQSRENLVCRLLLEKKKKKNSIHIIVTKR